MIELSHRLCLSITACSTRSPVMRTANSQVLMSRRAQPGPFDQALGTQPKPPKSASTTALLRAANRDSQPVTSHPKHASSHPRFPSCRLYPPTTSCKQYTLATARRTCRQKTLSTLCITPTQIVRYTHELIATYYPTVDPFPLSAAEETFFSQSAANSLSPAQKRRVSDPRAKRPKKETRFVSLACSYLVPSPPTLHGRPPKNGTEDRSQVKRN